MEMKKKFKSFDKRLLHWFNDTIKCKVLDRFMYRITNLGGGIFTTIILLAMIVFGKEKIRVAGIEGLTSLSVSQIFVQVLKRSLQRERPYNILKNINTFGINLRDYSFPSGHTTASFSIATTMTLNFPSISVILVILALTIGISRMYLGVHYPTDVIAGIVIGISSAVIIHFQFIELVEKFSYIIYN